jgi:hypothetical protein
MAENSASGGNPVASASFDDLYNTALGWSNMSDARTAATDTALAAAIGQAIVNGNTADSSTPQTVQEVVGEVDANGAKDANLGPGYSPSSAVTRSSAVGYPIVLADRTNTNSLKTASAFAPLISSDLTYDTLSNVGDARDYSATVPYPDIHFGYGTPGSPFIARQNWWQLYLHSQVKDAANTGLGQTAFNSNEYILSLYEVPAQLAISSSAFTNLGQINGTAWGANVSVTGNVYAKDANVQGGAALTGLSTTSGHTLSGGTVGGVGAGGDTQAAIDTFEYSTNPGSFFPISQASDFARSMFIPINTGIEFFDRYARTNPAKTNSRLSRESWAEYTRGCYQAAMQLDVTATETSDGVGATQVPTEVTLTYKTSSGTANVVFGVATGTLPNTETAGLPFHTTTTNSQPVLVVNIGELADYLLNTAVTPITAAQLAENHSIVVNAQYTTAGIENPQDASYAGVHMAVEMAGADDLSQFAANGFSFITNYELHLLENVNTFGSNGVEGATPTPPLSVYAPRIRYGQTSTSRIVTLTGSVGSLAENDASARAEVLDLKAVGAGNAISGQISATLRPIANLSELPPINVMNWLVVIQKKR